MKRLIVQVCAIILCTGMVALELFALSIDHQGLVQKNQRQIPSLSALSPSGSSVSTFAADWRPDEDGLAVQGLSMSMAPPRMAGNVFVENAEEKLFGTGSPESPGTPCSIDSSTMCIALSTHVYPVITGNNGNLLEGFLSDDHDASPPAPFSGSLLFTGFGLVVISCLWRRKGVVPVSSEAAVTSLPSASPVNAGQQENEEKAQSLAA
jgi:hypothetical protein